MVHSSVETPHVSSGSAAALEPKRPGFKRWLGHLLVVALAKLLNILRHSFSSIKWVLQNIPCKIVVRINIK